MGFSVRLLQFGFLIVAVLSTLSTAADPVAALSRKLVGQRVLVAYSGGPDALGLVIRLRRIGALPELVYIAYRQAATGGKTSIDLRHARRSARILGNLPVEVIRAPLDREKSHRNRFLVEVLSRLALERQIKWVGIGTRAEHYEEGGDWTEESNDDLTYEGLSRVAKRHSIGLVTCDALGMLNKKDQFADLSETEWRAVNATTSCQMWFGRHCGNCGSCVERYEAIRAVLCRDPTVYRRNSTAAKRKRKKS